MAMDFQWLREFPWRDVAATAILAFLFWRVFVKLTDIIVTRLDSIVHHTKELDHTLKGIAQNDLKHLSDSVDRIIGLLGCERQTTENRQKGG